MALQNASRNVLGDATGSFLLLLKASGQAILPYIGYVASATVLKRIGSDKVTKTRSSHDPSAASQFVNVVDDLQSFERRIILWADGWKAYRPKKPDHARWTIHRFTEDSAKKIPQVPGVYAFLIKPGIPLGLDVNVLIYIGKADKSIRSRYYRYLKESVDPVHGRPAVTFWLRKYFEYVHFAYAEVKRPGRPRALERRLLEALTPPANRQFSGKLRKAMNAFK